MSTRITIPARIKAYRRRLGLTQADFAALFGVSFQAVSKWERGECYPDITVLPALALVLGCSVDDFFEER